MRRSSRFATRSPAGGPTRLDTEVATYERHVASSGVRRAFRARSRAGGIVAATTILSVVASAALLASEPIASLLSTILASTFLASVVTSLVLARANSLPSALGGPAGNATAVVGAALASVVTRDPSVIDAKAVAYADLNAALEADEIALHG